MSEEYMRAARRLGLDTLRRNDWRDARIMAADIAAAAALIIGVVLIAAILGLVG